MPAVNQTEFMTAAGWRETLMDFCASREEFLLSDYAARIHSDYKLPELLIMLLPLLSLHRLGWEKTAAKDFRIFSIPRPEPLTLQKEPLKNMEAYLSHGEFDEELQSLIEQFIGQVTGKAWDDPVVLERIRSAIMQQKGQYWKEGRARKIGYRKGYAVLAYLSYHAPVYIVQSLHLLLMLARDGLLPSRARILDAGTGPGALPLAATMFARMFPAFSAEIFAVERADSFMEAYRFIVPRYASGISSLTIHPPLQADIRDAASLPLPSSLDLIVLQNVLNEIPGRSAEKAAVITAFSRLLAPDGSLLIVEPADRENSTRLRISVASALSEGLHIHSPCTVLRQRRCYPERCWSFIGQPPLRPTRLMLRLSGERETYRFQNIDIKYSYAVMVRDDRKRHPFILPKDAPYLPFSSLSRHTGKRVNVVGTVMSGNIGDGETHVFLLCDGTQSIPVYAVLPRYHLTSENRYLLTAPYSSVIELRQVLVRFNENHQAHNLLVSRRTRIRPVERECGEPIQ